MWGWEQLSTARLTDRIQTLDNALEAPARLIYLNATPEVDAEDGEMNGYFEDYAVSADIVMDDQQAVITSEGHFRMTTSAIPNIKKGTLITQAMVKLLRRLNRGGGLRGDAVTLDNYIRRVVSNRLRGIRVMQNRMLAGMMIDDWSYRKMGVEYRNLSWGMPSDLKFVPTVSWDQTTSTVIDDLLLYKRTSAETYGEAYNRLTLSTKAWNYIVRSDNFRLYAKLFTPAANAGEAFPVDNVPMMRNIFEATTELRIRIDDATWKDEANDATIKTARYLPENIGFLDDTGDDNNAESRDLANGVVTESEIGNMPGLSVIGGLPGGPRTGPMAYATVRGDLNPPNATIWTVARSFPRKHRPTSTARIRMWPDVLV